MASRNLGSALSDLTRRLQSARVTVGFMDNATYPDGTHVATVAAINNFGAPAAGIPARPFFSKTIEQGRMSWPDHARAVLKSTDMDARAALSMVGELIAGELRVAIRELEAPPLSPVTLMLRKMKSDDPDLIVTGGTVAEARRRVNAGENPGVTGTWAKPLVESGIMLNAITVELDEDV